MAGAFGKDAEFPFIVLNVCALVVMPDVRV